MRAQGAKTIHMNTHLDPEGLGLYSSAVLYSCTRAPAAELYMYESCSTAVLVLVLGIPTAVGELTY